MSLQFIFGNSGSGKSYWLYQRIIEESRKHPEGSYLVIVPEQFTMQTQRELVRLHPDGGIMNIDILSFGRLAHRVFEEVGADRRSVLTETGKNLMLRKVAIREKERLQVLGSRMNRTGYISEVKSVLSELMQYEVSDFELQEMERFSENRPLLHAKLGDLRTLYRAFLAYQHDRFLKPEEIYDVLCQVAGSSKLLRRSVLAFDGFAGFTPAQLRVLEELLVCSPQVYMTVTIDARESAFGSAQGHDLFAPSRKLVRAVCDAAERAGRRIEGNHDVTVAGGAAAKSSEEKGPKGAAAGSVSREMGMAGETTGSILAEMRMSEDTAPGFLQEPVVLGRECRPRFAKDGALSHLEQNLFRPKRAVYLDVPEELSLHVSPTPSDEVHFAARTIARLVRQGNLRYRDIAVITGDLSSYNNYVRRIFPQYDIPAFVDETRRILLNPCLEFVRGALELATQDFSYESVFRFLRTGMSGIGTDRLDRLENYVLAAGIRRRKKWEQEWTYRPRGMSEEELVGLNESRALVCEKLCEFAGRMRRRNRTLREYAECLYGLMDGCGLQQQLKDREQELLTQGLREEAREYAQIYGILIRLLDEAVDLLGEEKMEVREFTEILEAGLSEAKVGVIPPGIDQVQVGDIRRSRLSHVRVLFFLGLNDGWVPSHGDGGGIVSDMERELLKRTGIELAPTARENGYIQRFYLYQNLTKPQDRLYLSWCLGSSDGVVMRPSYLVSTIRRLFPKVRIIEEGEAGATLAQVTSKESGMAQLLRGLQLARTGEPEGWWLELYGQYRKDPSYSGRVLELVQAAFADGVPGKLSYYTTRDLYGEVMTNSVTRLEQFASCAFAHFALYGLRLSERELFGVRPADLGILFHRSLELFSQRIARSGRDWAELTEQEQTALMERCVDEVTGSYGADGLHENARAEYTVRRLKRILCRAAWALHEQLVAGRFRPVGFEVSFDDAAELEAVNVRFAENGRMRLQGRIDRIDTVETEDTVYVKIVDYKSGMTQFDPVSLYYGLQLQLVVYLNAALELEQAQHPGKQVVPAGIFYYHLQDPVLEKEAGMDNAQARERLLKKLRPDGILNSDETVLRLLDGQLSGDSLVIPVGLKKDGQPKAYSSVASGEQLDVLSRYVKQKLARTGEQMLRGEIAASPSSDGKYSACEYCQYSDVCGFDRKLPGMHVRRLPALSKKEVWERMEQECQGAEPWEQENEPETVRERTEKEYEREVAWEQESEPETAGKWREQERRVEEEESHEMDGGTAAGH